MFTARNQYKTKRKIFILEMLLKMGLKITIWIHLQAISERLQLRG